MTSQHALTIQSKARPYSSSGILNARLRNVPRYKKRVMFSY
jgi:hypothetical protein